MKDKKLVDAFDKARKASVNRQYIYGLMGKSSDSTPSECRVTGRPDFVYVRVSSLGNQSKGIARNESLLPLRADTPIKMVLDNNILIIVDYDNRSGRWTAATSGGDTVNVYGITKHNHKTGSGLEYEVESLRLEPGRVHSDSHNLIATVNSFRHNLGYFAGFTVDLSSYVPTVGLHGWALVGLNPVTNLIVVAISTPVIIATSLELTDIDSISFVGYIKLGAFKLTYGDTELSQYAYETREWFTVADGFISVSGSTVGATTSKQVFTKNVQAAWLDQPLTDSINGDHFDVAGSLPTGWMQVTAALSTAVLNGFWHLVGDGTNPAWAYKKQSAYTVESADKYYKFGPIILSDRRLVDDLSYYFALHRNNAGAVDANTYLRVVINWDQATQVWRSRIEGKDGTSVVTGSWYVLSGLPLIMPLYVSLFVDTTTGLCSGSVGNLAWIVSQLQFEILDLSASSAWGMGWLQISLDRGLTAGNDHVYIGAYDYE